MIQCHSRFQPWCFFPSDYVAPTLSPAAVPTGPAPSSPCNIFAENVRVFSLLCDWFILTKSILRRQQCQGNEIITDPSFDDHRWYTPGPGSKDYISSFQSFHVLVGHVHLTYDSSHTSATAEIIAEHRDKVALSYSFGGVTQSVPVKKFSSTSDKGPLSVAIVGADGARIDLEPIDFVWDAPAVHPLEEAAGDYRSGQKGAIMEAFMWPHAEVAKECSMLAKMGYLGVKLFPAQVIPFPLPSVVSKSNFPPPGTSVIELPRLLFSL